MTFTLPSAVHNFQADHDVDARARGDFNGASELGVIASNLKTAGWLPITGSSATQQRNHNSGSDGVLRGSWWEFLATGGYDVSSDTRLMVMTVQYNAPNRVEIDTVANQGIIVRLGSGTGTPPSDYRTFEVGGNDTVLGSAREFPRSLVIDLNNESHESTIGTFDNTDVECLGIGTRQAHLGGTNNLYFFQRMWVFTTTKNSSDIPRFTGSGADWDDIITTLGVAYNTKITHEWLLREGTVFSISCPIEIGNNSTVTTFNDNGVSVFWPDSDDLLDPKVRVTSQAFRVYLNLRNNVADTATFSGAYDCGNSYPAWDFDQDDSAVVTFTSPSFKRTGQFDIGSSVTGPASFEDCGVVWFQDNGGDLDGSTFKSPQAAHLLRLAA